MAKPVKTNDRKDTKKVKQTAFIKEGPAFFDDRNRLILGIGMVIIVLGFYALARPPVYGYMTLHVAPFLLVIGYLVVIPVGIMWGYMKQVQGKDKETKGD